MATTIVFRILLREFIVVIREKLSGNNISFTENLTRFNDGGDRYRVRRKKSIFRMNGCPSQAAELPEIKKSPKVAILQDFQEYVIVAISTWFCLVDNYRTPDRVFRCRSRSVSSCNRSHSIVSFACVIKSCKAANTLSFLRYILVTFLHCTSIMKFYYASQSS